MLLQPILAFTTLFISFAHADTSIPIKNFHEVTPEIYRGASPYTAGMSYLKTIPIKTDLDLETLQDIFGAKEKELAAANLIDFVNEPLLALAGKLSDVDANLDETEMNRIMELVSDPNGYPLFIHCKRGMDRTGLVVGLYRVLNQNWAPEDAWAEMLEYGYHPHYLALTRYFEEKTGWAVPSQ